uniref:RxLR effector protein n=1 Tax=Globisporangium ultimum (strain ATCC 200006 / CBS 805.95 / DAOM BR144) TaxID=431595 RepID=K3WYX3_GLOUD
MIKTALLSVFAIAAAYSTPVVHAEEEAGTSDIVLAGFQLATQVIPLIGELFKNKKKCHQVACWISTPKCYQQAADKVQNEVFKGRDGYRVESHNNQGAWVRYWRVKTDVSTINTIASGKCGDGSKFSVFNCQTTGKVHC